MGSSVLKPAISKPSVSTTLPAPITESTASTYLSSVTANEDKLTYCKVCQKPFLRFISHLNNNPNCKKHYDFDQVLSDQRKKNNERIKINMQNLRRKKGIDDTNLPGKRKL